MTRAARHAVSAVFVSLALSASACTVVGLDDADLEDEFLIGAITTRHPEVGVLAWDYQISPSGDAQICTGTLLARAGRAPVAVLTAGHCVEAIRDWDDDDGGPVFRMTDSLGRVTRLEVDRRSIVDYRSACAFPDTALCRWADIGLLRVSSATGAPRPARLAAAAPAFGTPVTFLGYGLWGTASYEDCSTSDEWGSEHKRYDEIEWGGSFYAGCPGDSGGPVMVGTVFDDAQPEVLQIYSGVNALILVTADIFGDPMAFRQQIETQLQGWGG